MATGQSTMPGSEHVIDDVKVPEVVIIDDEPDVAREIADGLMDEGYVCTVLDTAQGAIDLVRQSPGRFAVVVTDIRMPGMDGVTLARNLLALDAQPCPGIVMITGHAVPEEIETAFPDGAVAVVRKPFRWAEFIGEVQCAIARHEASRPGPG